MDERVKNFYSSILRRTFLEGSLSISLQPRKRKRDLSNSLICEKRLSLVLSFLSPFEAAPWLNLHNAYIWGIKSKSGRVVEDLFGCKFIIIFFSQCGFLFVFYTLFVNQLLTQEINACFWFIASIETLMRTRLYNIGFPGKSFQDLKLLGWAKI